MNPDFRSRAMLEKHILHTMHFYHPRALFTQGMCALNGYTGHCNDSSL